MNLTGGSWINCNSSCVSDCVRMCRFVSISVSVSVRAENKYSIQFSHFYRWQHWMLQHTKTVFALSIKLCLTIQLINIINQGGMFLLSFSLAKRSKQQQQQQNYFEIDFILRFAQISCNPRNSRWNFIANTQFYKFHLPVSTSRKRRTNERTNEEQKAALKRSVCVWVSVYCVRDVSSRASWFIRPLTLSKCKQHTYTDTLRSLSHAYTRRANKSIGRNRSERKSRREKQHSSIREVQCTKNKQSKTRTHISKERQRHTHIDRITSPSSSHWKKQASEYWVCVYFVLCSKFQSEWIGERASELVSEWVSECTYTVWRRQWRLQIYKL